MSRSYSAVEQTSSRASYWWGYGSRTKVFPRADNKRRIKAERFPAVKSLDTFDFLAIPSLNRQLVTQLA